MKYLKIELNNVNEKIIIDDGSICVCDKCKIEEHTCPFSEEIHNDCNSLCTCCTYCIEDCANNI